MTPEAGEVLLGEIAPRLRSAIPKCVQPVGAEDSEELMQDAIVVAAKMLHNVEQSGKQVTPGNIAYYTILHMKSGRRSQSAGRTDVMATGTQLDLKSSVLSMEEEVGYDTELDEPICLGQLLSFELEDPAMTAARDIDWEVFIQTHDDRFGVILQGMIEGRDFTEMAKGSGLGIWLVSDLRRKLATEVREFMGEDAIADSAKIPAWRAQLLADRERVSCRSDRRRW